MTPPRFRLRGPGRFSFARFDTIAHEHGDRRNHMSSPFNAALCWFLFLASALAAIALFFHSRLHHPPVHASNRLRPLALAMALRQRAPWGTLLRVSCARARICSGVYRAIVRSAGSAGTANLLAQRSFSAVRDAGGAFSAVMARLNYFEWMFHPVESAQFESSSASKLDPRRNDSGRSLRLRRPRLSHPRNGLPPYGQRRRRRRPRGRHVLNALSHRSGVDAHGERQGSAFLSGRHQQPEFPHARQRDRNLVAADHRQSHLWTAARARPSNWC